MYNLLIVLTYNRGYWGGFQVANVAIYYSMSQQETSKDIVEKIETLIKQIDDKILGVYIDPFGSSENFNKLIEDHYCSELR